MPVKGIERVKRNMRTTFQSIAGQRTEDGIYAILSQGAALSDQLAPRDTSFLVNSRYAPQVRGTSGHVGYTAEYAQWVHEMPGTLKGQPRGHFGRTGSGVDFGGGTQRGNYWDPNAVPHWMNVGFDKLQPSIPAILREVYRV